MILLPTVVNKYKEEYDVYIGRGSIWGNPFTHINDKKTKAEYIVSTREDSILKYRDYLIEQIEKQNISIEQLLGLCGKKLGCFCKPKSCHGDVIVEVVSEILDMIKNPH